MSNVKITYFLVIIQAVFVENKLASLKTDSGWTRPVNLTNSTRRDSDIFPENHFRFVLLCDRTDHPSCGNVNGTSPARSSRASLDQVRWTEDVGRFSSAEAKQRAAPVKKSAHFDLVTDDGEEAFPHYNPYKETGNDQQEPEDEDENDEEEEEGGEEPDDDDYSFDLLETDDKPAKKKTHREEDSDDEDSDEEDEDEEEDEEEEDGTPKLKHLFKHKLKMKDLMFLLLLAYKLKFVTLVPLFLKALILLVGTTSMAGFFFALFSAALGLQSTRQRR